MGTLPTNYAVNAGTLLEGFEDHTSWTSSGTGTKSDNTDSRFIKSGSKSLRIQGATSGALVVHKAAASLNLTTGTMVGLWVYDNGTAGTLSKVQLHFATDSTVANRFSYIWDSTNVSIARGWNFLSANRDAFTKTGTLTWADADYLRLQVDSTGVGGCDVYLDSLYRSFYTRPMVMFHFDDNHGTIMDAYTYMHDKGLRGTLAFQSNNLNVTDYMTDVEINAAYEAGWDVANHTDTHANLTAITSAQRLDELGTCRDVMEANGWTRTINYFVAPQGGLNNDAVTDLQAAGFVLARGGRSLFTNAQQSNFQGIDNPYRLISKDVGNSGVSLATAKGYVDDCIRLGSTLMLVFHKFGASADSLTMTTSDFESLVDYVHLKQQSNILDIPTLYEWHRGFSRPRRLRRFA